VGATVIDPGFALKQLNSTGAPVDVIPGDDGTIWVATLSSGGFNGGIAHLGVSGMGTTYAMDGVSALATDNQGGVWATLPSSDHVVHIDRAGSVRTWTAPTRNAGPVAAYDSGGYVYFVEHDAGRLGRIDEVTGDITDYPIAGASFPDSISGIADADGSHHTVWVTDRSAGTVWVMGTDGSLQGSITSLGDATDIQLLASVNGLVEGVAMTNTTLLYFKQVAGSTPVVELVSGRTSISAMQAYDGGIWFADSGTGSLLHFKGGSLAEYDSPEVSGRLLGIATDGRYVWTGERDDDHLIRLDLQARRTVTRIGGADRFDVSARVSAQSYPSGASTVFIASGGVFADALSVGPLAARAKAPLLLTARDTLPSSVGDELRRLGPEQVVIVGGVASVSKATEAAIAASAPGSRVRRIDGADRYAVSQALLASTYAPASAGVLYVANGTNYPDALSSGPAAADASTGVLLVNGSATAVSGHEMDVITRFVDAGGTVRIAGGPNSVSAAIEAQIRSVRDVERIGGADRYEVSRAINAEVFTRPSAAFVASGSAFADALSGGAAAGAAHSPIYLSQPNCLPRVVVGGVLAPPVGQVTLLGGTATLSPAVENLAVCP
jgi:putative cell wall-binding protein/streptogramin lyase